MKTYIFHTDPGHGWLAVKRKELIQLGLIDQISRFSYQSKTGQTVYLEEDCDLDLFFNKYEEVFGIKPAYEESHQERTSIRSLPSFKK